MKPTVFLTGSSGRIGKRVLNKLLSRGYRVKALIHKNKPEGLAAGDVEFVHGDILDRNQMIAAAEGSQIICHLAATFDMFPPIVFEKDNTSLFDNIIRGTFNLLEAARNLSEFKLFVFASTDALYATGPIRYDTPITEETSIHPMPGRFYALAKAVGESLCRNYGKTYEVPWTVIRINWALQENELLRIFRYGAWNRNSAAARACSVPCSPTAPPPWIRSPTPTTRRKDSPWLSIITTEPRTTSST